MLTCFVGLIILHHDIHTILDYDVLIHCKFVCFLARWIPTLSIAFPDINILKLLWQVQVCSDFPLHPIPHRFSDVIDYIQKRNTDKRRHRARAPCAKANCTCSWILLRYNWAAAVQLISMLFGLNREKYNFTKHFLRNGSCFKQWYKTVRHDLNDTLLLMHFL